GEGWLGWRAWGWVGRSGRATAIVVSGKTAASGASSVGRVEVFGGQIVVRTVNGAARGGATSAGFDGTAVVGLRVRGKPVAKRGLALGSWGTLTVHRSGTSKGTRGYHSFVTALELQPKTAPG